MCISFDAVLTTEIRYKTPLCSMNLILFCFQKQNSVHLPRQGEHLLKLVWFEWWALETKKCTLLLWKLAFANWKSEITACATLFCSVYSKKTIIIHTILYKQAHLHTHTHTQTKSKTKSILWHLNLVKINQ